MITELDVVNDALASMGEFPVNEVSEDHAFVSTALRALKANNEKCQQSGWWFNREYLTLIPDAISKLIYLPGDTLHAIPFCTGRYGLPFLQRGRQLYNPQNQSFIFDRPVDVELIRRIPFDMLPPSAQAYVSAKALLDFQIAYDADRSRTEMLMLRVREAYAELRKEDIRTRKINLFNGTTVGAQVSSLNHGIAGIPWGIENFRRY